MASGPSTSSGTVGDCREIGETSLKDIMNEGIYACIQILKSRGIISGKVMETCSQRARFLAYDMVDAILAVIQDYEFAEEDELFGSDEILEESLEESLDDSLHIQSPCSAESGLSGKKFTRFIYLHCIIS